MINEEEMWNDIAELVNSHGYMSGVDRMSDRVKKTGEVFTPTHLVIDIIRKMDRSLFAPGKTVVDPACGDGQFLVPVLCLKMFYFGMKHEEAIKDIYGVDIMRDNVELCKARLGGGNIIMGNTLNPDIQLPEQTLEEFALMKDWFGSPDVMSFGS